MADLEHWKITAAEYREFLYYVQDSIARERFGWDLSDGYHRAREDYYDLPPVLDYSIEVNWDKLSYEQLETLHYRLCTFRNVRLVGEALRPDLSAYQQTDVRPFFRADSCQYAYYSLSFENRQERLYHDSAASYVNQQGQLNPVPQWVSVEEAYARHSLNVYPDTAQWRATYHTSFFEDRKNQGVLMPGLTYAQAVAYYHWRRDCPRGQRRKVKASKKHNPIPKLMIPTEAQWESVMRGESPQVSQPVYPAAPAFRYVVRMPAHHYTE